MKKGGILSVLILMLAMIAFTSSATYAAITDGYYQLSQPDQATWDGTDANRQAKKTTDYIYTYGDEASVTYSLPWPITFYGQTYTQITADTNGNVWFGSSESAHSFNLANSGRGPVIAAWNNDLSSYYYGGVFIQHKISPSERVVVEWQTETYTNEGFKKLNDFEVVLFPNGNISLDYKSFSATNTNRDFGSGISKGDGSAYLDVTANFGNVFNLVAGSSFVFDRFRTPIVTTGPAGNITQSAASLSGTVSDNGDSTTSLFEYGTDKTAYGNTLSAGTVAAGAGNTAINASLTGLTCGTAYYYRVSATNSYGTVKGKDQTFTTNDCYTISSSATPPGGGTITPNGTTSVYEGDSITFIITPAGGYDLANLNDNGVTVTPGEGPIGSYTYSLNNVGDNHTVQATFGVVPYTTSFSPANGTTNVASNAAITATFNEAMKPDTITTGSFAVSRFVGIKQVAIGDSHTVVLKNDGTVAAWGGNGYGQATDHGYSGIAAIAAGADHTVALKNDGTVVTWGNNDYGQTTAHGVSGVTAIAAGYYHTVALNNNGTVVAWGDNSSGQSTVPTGLSGVTAIAAGFGHTVALKNDGTAVVWGDNYYGQTAIPAGLSGVTAIAAGGFHTVALKSNGTVVAWGDNSSGQCTIPAGLSGVTAIAAGSWYTVALKSDGTVVAWGSNWNGESTVPAGLSAVTAIATGTDNTVALKNDGTMAIWGNNNYSQSAIPRGLSGITAVAAGGSHDVVLKNDGTVAAWGNNYSGQTMVPAGLSGVTATAAGLSHSVALKNDGTVIAWGSNSSGQTTVPVGLSGVIAIAAGDYSTVALKNNGTVVVWGDNTYGQTAIPSGVSGVTAIAGGQNHIVALKGDGTVVAWGDNSKGQSAVPAGLSGVIAIAAGGPSTVALKSNGTVVVWGDNTYGQTAVPAGLSGVIAIAAGSRHIMALKNNGTVVVWGDTTYGQGVVPAGLNGVIAIAGGQLYTVALKNNGTLIAWGYNYCGQATAPATYSIYDTAVSGTVTYNSATLTATFTPTNPLVAGTYNVKVAGPRSLAGLPLATQIKWSFTVPGIPTVSTGSAGNITQTGATLHGTVNDNGDATTAGFDYGTTTAYGSTVSAGSVAAGAGSTAVTANLTGLACNTTYNYRVSGTNSAGTAAGTDLAFTTSVCPPPIYTISSSSTPGGTITPNGTTSVTEGDSISFTIIPTGGYDLANLSDNGVTVTPGEGPIGTYTYTINKVAGNHTVQATFGAVPVATSSTPANGTTNVASNSAITATFNEAMKPDTITTGSFAVSRFVGIKQAAVGDSHIVVLKNDGTVAAWGGNGYGQTTDHGYSGVAAIAAGADHTVVLKNDGTVAAWGSNDFGQTTIPPGLSGVTAITAGYFHTVALKNNGTVAAWGVNDVGQSTVPTGLSGVTAIAAGYDHTVALKNDGTVVVWGDNYYGQTAIPAGLSGVTAIAAGGFHTVALKGNGTVVAWGDNSSGQCTIPAGLSGVTAIAAGGWYTVALKSDGTVVAWGSNWGGESTVPAGLSAVTAIATGTDNTVALKSNGTMAIWGNNNYSQSAIPAGLSGITAVAAGTSHDIVLKNDGTVAAWGNNYSGQTTVPAGLSGVTAIAAGYIHSVALKNDGTVIAWGSNSFGQTTVPAGLGGVIAIAAGDYSTVALKNNGTVVVWGDNTYGQTTIPSGVSGVTAIAGGQNHIVALKGDGTVIAWGDNSKGQTTVPAGLSGVIAIAAGGGSTVALKNNGTVVVWGDNTYGQTAVPAGLSGVTAIAAGSGHIMALKSNGTVVAWGDNTYGQSVVPAGLNGVIAIAAGDYHNVSLMKDGTLTAWGYNYCGQATAPAAYSIYDAAVSGTVTYNPATLTATFTPTNPLVVGTYNVTVAGPRSTAGLPLATQIKWSFFVPGAPTVSTGSSVNIARTAATLHGTINDNGDATTAGFDYGTTTAYGSTVSAGTVAAGSGSTAVSANLNGLVCNTTYHYRVSGSNSYGTTTGNDQAFTTSACLIYTISSSISPTGGGTVTPSGTTSVTEGGSITFTIAPNTGYHIQDVVVDGVSKGPVTNYNFPGVNSNHTISATFAVNTYVITATAGSNGSISPSGAVTLNYGGNQTFTITPNASYHIQDVVVDGVSKGPITSYNFPSVVSDHTISASFAINTFTISITSSACGVVSPGGPVVLGQGSSQTFTFQANPGSYLADVQVDGVSVGIVSSYTISSVAANHNLTVKFIIPDGDVDLNGIVDKADSDAALRLSVGLDVLTPLKLAHGDVAPLNANGAPAPDGKITSVDALIIQRKAAGLSTWSTVCAPTQQSLSKSALATQNVVTKSATSTASGTSNSQAGACMSYYKKLDEKTLMGILDMVTEADTKGKVVVVNNGHSIVTKKINECETDLEIYDDDKQAMQLCSEKLVYCIAH